jgi:hypothetical protein
MICWAAAQYSVSHGTSQCTTHSASSACRSEARGGVAASVPKSDLAATVWRSLGGQASVSPIAAARLGTLGCTQRLAHCCTWNLHSALSREGDPDSETHQVASSKLWSERSQVRVLPASDRVAGDPLFLKELFVSHVNTRALLPGGDVKHIKNKTKLPNLFY